MLNLKIKMIRHGKFLITAAQSFTAAVHSHDLVKHFRISGRLDNEEDFDR